MANLELGRSQMTALHASLTAAASSFAELFEARSHAVVGLSPEVAGPMLGAGLIAESDGGFIGLHRMRYRENRFYLMEYLPGEYRQDIWPETDSLLEVLESAKPGRLLDMGTGTGIVAIEAAARGHQVVATDLYDATLKLAQFNARLNGIEGIEFRQGHLFEPVINEKFDLILTAPHYTRSADQLRLEALRTGPECIAEGGRLVVATFFEWEGDGAPIPIVENLLEPLAQRGFTIKVVPIVSPVKRNWFTRAVGVEKLVSRHRFLVSIVPGGGEISVERPAQQLDEPFVPLSRLRLDGARVSEPAGRAVVSTDADMARLRDLLVELAGGLVTLSGALPEGMLDSCRWGDGPCVSQEDAAGAAGAILDLSGGVRPCTAGRAIGQLEDRHSTLLARQRALANEAFERRGCATCEAVSWCSRCLFPAPLDERHYCAVMRAAAPELQQLHRLMELLPRLTPEMRRIQVKMRRTSALVAALGRPHPPGPPHPRDAFVLEISLRWHRAGGWIIAGDDDRYLLSWLDYGRQQLRPVDRLTAGLMELAADGALGDELHRYAIGEHIPPDAAWRALDAIAPPALL